MAGAQYPKELANWALVSVGIGAVEGAVAAALVRARFADAASPLLVDLAMALVAGAPAYANLASFLFAAHQLGRDKIQWTVRWQSLALCAVLGLALVMIVPVLGLGAAWEALLLALSMNFLIGIATGLGMLLALEFRSRRADLLACFLLCCSLTCGGVGLAFLVGACVDVLVRRDFRRVWQRHESGAPSAGRAALAGGGKSAGRLGDA